VSLQGVYLLTAPLFVRLVRQASVPLAVSGYGEDVSTRDLFIVQHVVVQFIAPGADKSAPTI
jgi:hypothetical protein